LKIALVGDRNDEVIAHRAIPLALECNARQLNIDCAFEWIATDVVIRTNLAQFDAIWCVPASPYTDRDGALKAIQYARENKIAFLGTCGGYQHSVLEFARNMLGYNQADNTEENPQAEMPLIAGLQCKLVEKSAVINLQQGSRVYALYQQDSINEEYHCSYGVNPDYLSIFRDTDMCFTGFDADGEPRVLEVANHPFFIGTAFQPERSALQGKSHPLVTEFLRTAMVHD